MHLALQLGLNFLRPIALLLQLGLTLNFFLFPLSLPRIYMPRRAELRQRLNLNNRKFAPVADCN